MSINRELDQGLKRRDPRCLARLLTLLESFPSQARPVLRRLWPQRKSARRIGITGPPGSGKSTLINKLIGLYRAQKKTVGILAIDPTSPLSGGAFLGDRVRMQEHATDPGVFIRSMANREKMGGTCPGLYDALAAMEIFGFDILFLETIGAGQADTALRPLCETVLVLAPPDSVDMIQALKSGLLDVADIFVIHKADLPAADHAQKVFQEMLYLRQASRGSRQVWETPVVPVSSLKDSGLNQLLKQIDAHAHYLQSHGGQDKYSQHRFMEHLRELMVEKLNQRLASKNFHKVNLDRDNPYDVS